MDSYRGGGMGRWEGREPNPFEEVKMVKQNMIQSDGSFYCKLCEAEMQSESTWLQHITGKKHIKKMQKEEHGGGGGDTQSKVEPVLQSKNSAPRIQKALDKLQEPVLGLSHMVEINKDDGQIIYKCDLCLSVDSSSSVVDHIISMRHRVNYMKKADPGGLELINSMKLSKPAKNALIEEKACELETKEGRGKMEVKVEIIEKPKVPDKRPSESDEMELFPNKKIHSEELARSMISYPVPAAQHNPTSSSAQSPFPDGQRNFMGPRPTSIQDPFPAMQHDYMGSYSKPAQGPPPAAREPPNPSVKDVKFYRMETKLKMLEELSRKVIMTIPEAETVVNAITRLSQATLEYKIDSLMSKEEVLQRNIEAQDFKLRNPGSRSSPAVWLDAQPHASHHKAEVYPPDGMEARMPQHHPYSFTHSSATLPDNICDNSSRMWFPRTF